MNATCSFAQHLINGGKPAEEILSVANYFCRSAQFPHRSSLCRDGANADAPGYALVQDLLGGKHELLRTGIV